jgi:hypothetical protein
MESNAKAIGAYTIVGLTSHLMSFLPQLRPSAQCRLWKVDPHAPRSSYKNHGAKGALSSGEPVVSNDSARLVRPDNANLLAPTAAAATEGGVYFLLN